MFIIHHELELIVTTMKSKESDSFQNGKICPAYLNFSKKKACKYPEINIYYGPYECNRIIKYRPAKLDGLIIYLKNLSYNVKLIPFGYINTVEVVCMGYVIHRFDIRFLKFNMPYKDDEACMKVINVIKEAINRLYSENNFTIKRVLPKIRRGTTMSLSSQISLSEYDNFLDIYDF